MRQDAATVVVLDALAHDILLPYTRRYLGNVDAAAFRPCPRHHHHAVLVRP